MVTGALLGQQESRAARRQAGRQYAAEQRWRESERDRQQANWQGQTLTERVREAKQAGVSPSLALGASAPQAPAAMPTVQTRVPVYQDRGSQVMEALSKFSSLLAVEKQRQEVRRERAVADNYDLQLRTNLARIHEMNARTNAARLAMDYQEYKSRNDTGPMPMYRGWYNNLRDMPPGTQFVSPDPELAEGMEGTGPLGLTVYGNSNMAGDAMLRDLEEWFRTEAKDLFTPDWLRAFQ